MKYYEHPFSDLGHDRNSSENELQTEKIQKPQKKESSQFGPLSIWFSI